MDLGARDVIAPVPIVPSTPSVSAPVPLMTRKVEAVAVMPPTPQPAVAAVVVDRSNVPMPVVVRDTHDTARLVVTVMPPAVPAAVAASAAQRVTMLDPSIATRLGFTATPPLSGRKRSLVHGAGRRYTWATMARAVLCAVALTTIIVGAAVAVGVGRSKASPSTVEVQVPFWPPAPVDVAPWDYDPASDIGPPRWGTTLNMSASPPSPYYPDCAGATQSPISQLQTGRTAPRSSSTTTTRAPSCSE